MKKFLLIIIVFSSMFMISGCGKEKDIVTEEDLKKVLKLNVYELKYHNVAKFKKSKHEGFAGLFEKDRKYWIEYDGIARLGIDVKETKIDIKDTKVKIYLPVPVITMISIDNDSLNKDSFISSADSIINSNKITDEEQKSTLEKGQQEMVDSILSNSTLLKNAQIRAKRMIENHINRISEVTGVEYEVEWELEEIVIKKDTKK